MALVCSNKIGATSSSTAASPTTIGQLSSRGNFVPPALEAKPCALGTTRHVRTLLDVNQATLRKGLFSYLCASDGALTRLGRR